MVKLLDNLWLVAGDKLTHPWDASAYLITGDQPTLIDCGSAEGYPALKANLREAGYAPSDIRRILATHGHWDHLSAAAQLQAESDAQLFIHAADRAQVETGDVDLTSAFLYGKPLPPARVDGELRDGDELRVNGVVLHVLHTPGHSPGSVCFWTEVDGLKLLIAGDTLWGAFHPRVASDLDAWQRSLDRLLALNVDAYTAGHCPPALLVDAKRRLWEARQQFGVYFDPWFKPFNIEFRY